MSSGANNALTAKARAMFGKRLKEEDYKNLLGKKAVSDIATYLKTNTYFEKCLWGINDKAIHRGQLEVLLRTDIFNRLSRLILYADDSANNFIRIAIMDTEIDILLMIIRGLSQPAEERRHQAIVNLPIYAEKFMSFDVKALTEVKDIKELQTVVQKTPYFNVLLKYVDNTLEDIDFVALEHELRLCYFRLALASLENVSPTSDAYKMKQIILSRVELDNISIIYRLKKYFSASPNRIKMLISDYYSFFSKNELYDMIDHCSADEIIEKLQQSRYARYLDDAKFTYIEHYTKLLSYKLCYRFIEMYKDANMVLLAYLFVSEIEIQNVIDIIEGVRYNVGADKIKPLLIY